MARKGKGVADVVGRVVDCGRSGKPDAINDENAEQHRGQRGKRRAKGRCRKAAGDRVKHRARSIGEGGATTLPESARSPQPARWRACGAYSAGTTWWRGWLAAVDCAVPGWRSRAIGR